MTLVEISKVLGVSIERVRQIEQMALSKLAHPRNLKKWQAIKETLILIEQEKAKRNSRSKETLDEL